MRPRFDMGRVHDGFFAALFYSDEESGSLYAQIIEGLQQTGRRDVPILLSGDPQASSPICRLQYLKALLESSVSQYPASRNPLRHHHLQQSSICTG